MSRSDFEQCTPLEFSKIVESWDSADKARYREGWERTRIQVVSVANLFSKHPLNPLTAFPLPWDKGNMEETARAVPKGTSSPERMREIEARLKRD